MAYPTKPDRDYSYTAFEQSQGDASFPGTELDNDLDNLQQSIEETIDFVELFARSDGSLANGVVHKNALGEDVLLGVEAPRPWVTATEYAVNDSASTLNSLYICTIAHTSGVFADDLAAGRWEKLIEFTVPVSIADGSITEPKYETGSVSTRALADGAVATAKIPDGAVAPAKLSAAALAAQVPVGAEFAFSGAIPPAGYLFEFGQTVSRTTYAALLAVLAPAVIGTVSNGSATINSVDTDLRNLGLEGSPIEGPGIAGGTTVTAVTATTLTLSVAASATTASTQVRLFPHGRGDGSTTFHLPDDRDRVGVGRGNMGGTASARITTTGAGTSGLDTARLGASGGADRLALTPAQGPIHDHAIGTFVSDPGHAHAAVEGSFQQLVGGSTQPDYIGGSTLTTTAATTAANSTGITVTAAASESGGGEAHPNVQPSRVRNTIIFTGVV